ncbi:MAG: nucleotidyltransferase domain-containing protein [Deltaproteobacteria bacterium]|nr:nucleotidyltransferase domain-containing protein [Deltaproteobacteria bacterium]
MKRSLKDPDKKRLISAIADRLETLRPDLVAAYVFGSFVTGEGFADIDLGILLKEKPAQPLKLELDLESELEKTAPCPVDVRVLNGARISFSQSVIRAGEVIVDPDPDQRADFEGWVLKKYFDFAPFRARYLSEVANAPL